MLHVINRFLVVSNNGSNTKRVDYRRFADHYTNSVQEDNHGFVNLGQLPMTTTTSTAMYEEEQSVEDLADRLANMAERQMYSGGEALNPNVYAQQQMPRHDQTDRLNRALAGAMLSRMNNQAQQTLIATKNENKDEVDEVDFDPAILTEEELANLMARR
jgi:hypothetical protein